MNDDPQDVDWTVPGFQVMGTQYLKPACGVRLELADVGSLGCTKSEGHFGPCTVAMTEVKVLIDTYLNAIART